MKMENEAALPTAEQAAASTDQAATDAARAIDQDANAGELTPEQQAAAKAEKPEKTPEQREIERLRRGIDRRTKQLYEERARNAGGLTSGKNDANYQPSADDSEPLSLTRAQIDELVRAEAQKLAPTLREQAAEAERRQSVVHSLAKTWGQERFDELSSDLDAAFDGLADRSGRPKPAIEAVFEADHPAQVIEWLADPQNSDEAERISRLNAVQAGKAIAKLEARLSAETPKPQASKAPAPLEAVKGSGPAKKALADLDGADFDRRRREQIANRR